MHDQAERLIAKHVEVAHVTLYGPEWQVLPLCDCLVLGELLR
jgi:hypothetical protein